MRGVLYSFPVKLLVMISALVAVAAILGFQILRGLNRTTAARIFGHQLHSPTFHGSSFQSVKDRFRQGPENPAGGNEASEIVRS